MNQPVRARRGPAAESLRSRGPAPESLRARGPAPARPGRVDPSPRHLRVVSARRRGRRAPFSGTRLVLVSAALLAVGVVFGLVYLHVMMAQRQFALDRLDQQRASAEAHYEDLRLQVAQLSSPQQIMATAEGKLGMRPPASVTYLTTPPAVAGLTGAAGIPHGAVVPAAPASASAAPAALPGGAGAGWPRIKALLAGRP